MANFDYDFSGWATRNDLKCSDGRIIRRGAFKHLDGVKVPLVWNHDHVDMTRVIGHAWLENRDEGVYTYGKFNDTDLGRNAKLLVQHGDVTALSIYANQLKQQGPNVMHGNIREVSLVLAGANPGAYIENVMSHSADINEEEARIFTGMEIEINKKGDTNMFDERYLEHASDDEETIADILDTLNDKQMKAVYALVGMIAEGGSVAHSDDLDDEDTIEDILDTMTPEQQDAVYALVGAMADDDDDDDDEYDDYEDDEDYEVEDDYEDDEDYEVEDDYEDDEDYDYEDSEGGYEDMKHNVFDMDEQYEGEVLTHSEMEAIFSDAKRLGSLKQAVIEHGIEEIGELFPNNKNLDHTPQYIKRDDTWVADVLGSVHHTPFARIKSLFADVTMETARAKGYAETRKGKIKYEEVFKLLKRTTNPTTIYKKQKLDRDDVLDITDFDLIPWLKAELRMMLNEEIARAILVGDGREVTDEDKIDEECIRPIWKMEELFTVKHVVEVDAAATADKKAREFIKACVKSRKKYKGSGNPVMFMSEDMLTDCLLIEDTNQRVIYDSVEKLAAALRVRKIIPVPVMEGLTRTEDGETFELAGIYVNLADYNVGTDKNGQINMFDDFDIDYNQMKYLMETRFSGSLTKPHSAVVIEFTTAAQG